MKPAAVRNRSAQADELIRANGATAAPAPAPEPQPGDLEPPQGFDAGAPQSEITHLPITPTGDDIETPGEDVDASPGTPEHRFRVLQGKYNAETKRLRDRTGELETQIAEMRNLMALLATAKPEPAAAPAKAEAPPEPAPQPAAPLSAKELEDYGSNLMDAALRHVLASLAPRLAKIDRALSDLGGRVSDTASTATAARKEIQLTARERMHADLDREVSDWHQVNADEAFKAWLRDEDEMSGVPRQTLLVGAYDKNDAKRVIRIFKAYKSETATGTEPAAQPAQPSNGNPAPAAATRNGQVDPATLVAPGRGRAAPHNGAQQKLTWTPADISRFYADVQKGHFRKNPDEQARLEADIFAAQHEGRIQI